MSEPEQTSIGGMLHNNNKTNSHSTLKSKHVEIKGQNDFGRDVNLNSVKPRIKAKPKTKPMTTQRVSKNNVSRMQALTYFLPERVKSNQVTFDVMLDNLIEVYVEKNLSPRQKELFKSLNELD